MNPRAAVNDLHPFQGCPFGQLGYFSKYSCSNHFKKYSRYRLEKEFFRILFQTVSPPNGEGGIRTHVPLRTNGFQDRLVMTTSIPLHVIFSPDSAQDIYYHQCLSVSTDFFIFLQLFFQTSSIPCYCSIFASP